MTRDESVPVDPIARARQRDRDLTARELDFAQWIADAARISYGSIFGGCGWNRPARRARCRELIVKYVLADRRVHECRCENFAERFARLYGEPLSQHDPTPSHSLPPTQPELLL